MRATVVLPTPPLSAPTTTTVGFAMVDPSLTPRRPMLDPSGSAIHQKTAAKSSASRPLPDSVLHILRAVWKPDVARALLSVRERIVAPLRRRRNAIAPAGDFRGMALQRFAAANDRRHGFRAWRATVRCGPHGPGAEEVSMPPAAVPLARSSAPFSAAASQGPRAGGDPTGRRARGMLGLGLVARSRRRRQRERAGIVAAGELDQRRDPALDRRMGVEQLAEALARIVDAHFHHRGGRARQFAAAFDLAQRRDHGVGILGELDRAGIGEEFARARQREADDEGEQIGDAR